MIDPQLAGRVALITGANHGIGAACALALARQGCPVLAQFWRMRPAHTPDSQMPEAYLAHRAQAADEVIAEIEQFGGRSAAWECDLSDPVSIPTLFDQAESALGPVEVLVNNAAHWEPGTFVPGGQENPNPYQWPPAAAPISAESLDRSFAVNARAAALMMAEFARRHAARAAGWGRIINISTDGADCFPGEADYGASKHALESLSRTAAVELGRQGITVNIVSPGPIQTDWITPELEAVLAKSTPLGRVGQPDDVADAVVMLASHQARWVTGQLLRVGGGHRI